MIAVVIATGVYGRHLETELQLHDTEYVTMKKWNQDRMERPSTADPRFENECWIGEG